MKCNPANIIDLGQRLHNGLTLDEFMVEVALTNAFRTREWPQDTANDDSEDAEDIVDQVNDIGSPPDWSLAGVAQGETLYQGACSYCHGDDGQGGSGPNLRQNVPELSDQQLYEILVLGQAGMPGGLLTSREDVAAVMAFLRGWENSP